MPMFGMDLCRSVTSVMAVRKPLEPMLTIDSFIMEGIRVDADLFRQKLVLLPFEDDDDDDASESASAEGYVLRHDLLGLVEKVRGKIESLMASRIQRVVDDWIKIWNQRYEDVLAVLLTDQLNEKLDKLLSDSLHVRHELDIDAMRSSEAFESTDIWRTLRQELEGIQPPAPPKMPITPPQPQYAEPELGISDSLLFRKRRLLREASEAFDEKLAAWQKVCDRIKIVIEEKRADHALEVEMYERRRAEMMERIEAHRNNFLVQQREHNEGVDMFQANYQGCQSDAVERYVNAVLDKSPWPDMFPRKRVLEYNRDNRTLYISFELPHPSCFPRDHQSSTTDGPPTPRQAFTQQELGKRYNEVVYRALLRHLHEVFTGDKAATIDAIQISGWVRTLNRGNGQYEDNTIATLFCTRGEFSGINLHQVDPTLCFRFLKGVSAPDLSELIPVPAPHRFQQRDEVPPTQRILEPMDGRTNLAGLGMSEFGQNVMDLFEKEFRLMPGEIKVLHENADELEAWGMDPEPIRGGKFILQARKSNHAVPATAVKELYGSMVHEGATKGILLTTSDFAPEAYEFARNKPMILLNGSQLLALFEKHGVPARISFREAISLKSWLS